MRIFGLLNAAIAIVLAQGAMAVEPVGETFNLETDIDLANLNKDNFHEVLEPRARVEGTLVFYDFTESFTPLFQDHIIPAWQRDYPDIEVQYFSVDGDAAVQQLIAARTAGQPSPVDVFFIPNGSVRTADEAGIIANLPLNTMLPSAQDLAEEAATVSRGYEHGGKNVPFHRNQTAMGYDTRFVDAETAPRTFDALLAYAKADPGTVAVTSPARGGSGSGFLESAILHFASDECLEKIYDYAISEADAKAWADSECLDPVMAYFDELIPEVEVTNGNSDTLTLIANGEAHIGTVWEDMAYDFMGRGLLPPTVRLLILDDGQVGDGDGLVIPSGAQHPAAGLLFIDFLLSDEIQLMKLEQNGSRTARTSLDIEVALGEEVAQKLVPTEQYSANGLPRISGTISSAAQDRFVEQLLQQ